MSAGIDRRCFISLAAASAMVVPRPAPPGTAPAPRFRTIAFYDSGMAFGLLFAAHARSLGFPAIDIAQTGGLRAASKSAFWPAAGDIAIGLTRWADWVTLRAMLAEARLRARCEIRIDGPLSHRLLTAELLRHGTRSSSMVKSDDAAVPSAGFPTHFAWVVA
jgi:hypothetical protein